MSKNLTLIKYVVFFILVPLFIGCGVGWLMNTITKSKVQDVTIEKQVDDYKSQFNDIIIEMGEKQKTDSSDHIINTYILKSYYLYEQVYDFTVQEDLLKNNQEQFNRTVRLMNSIYEWQMKKNLSRKNILFDGGFSDIAIIESKQNNKLMEDLTLKTCKEVLDIDPDNQQALETINKINS
jgi:hypothetical protein